ncbi:MAG: cellulose synthase operon protein YhjQ/BcsQ [Plesiomonas sp.]|uniref:cellulose synthase operon protein YhjQ/BcsQ n=1 Tax=Plesiomonas sp. TaxID=2486279 RepID=UPI003F4008CB
MPVIAIQGIRGGCGATTVAAGLAAALQSLNYPVLLWDLSPNNLLGQHLGLPFSEPTGWANAITQEQPWHHAAFTTEHAGLQLLPFGLINNIQALNSLPEDWLSKALTRLDLPRNSWVILDTPLYPHFLSQQAEQAADIWLQVTEADPACHALMQSRLPTSQNMPTEANATPENTSVSEPDHKLANTEITPQTSEPQPDAHKTQNNLHQDDAKNADLQRYWLVNRYHTATLLSRDIWQLWHTTLGQWLIPSAIHQDEALREALAKKQLITRSAPGSLAMQDFLSLATWCKAQLERP